MSRLVHIGYLFFWVLLEIFLRKLNLTKNIVVPNFKFTMCFLSAQKSLLNNFPNPHGYRGTTLLVKNR